MMGWMAPLRHQCAKLVFSKNHQEREPSMSEITTVGLDLAKHVFRHRCGGYHGSAQTAAAQPSAGILQPTSALLWWEWKRVRRRTTGRASWPRLGMRYG